jgi:hypothetical protein
MHPPRRQTGHRPSRITAARGRNIDVVAAARKLLTYVSYGCAVTRRRQLVLAHSAASRITVSGSMHAGQRN